MSIYERLREARIAAGLSQGQAAKILNMHRPTVTEIEAGRRKVSAEEIPLFADAYGVSSVWLMEGAAGSNGSNEKMLLAARELSKMSDEDLDRLMNMLSMLRGSEGR